MSRLGVERDQRRPPMALPKPGLRNVCLSGSSAFLTIFKTSGILNKGKETDLPVLRSVYPLICLPIQDRNLKHFLAGLRLTRGTLNYAISNEISGTIGGVATLQSACRPKIGRGMAL